MEGLKLKVKLDKDKKVDGNKTVKNTSSIVKGRTPKASMRSIINKSGQNKPKKTKTVLVKKKILKKVKKLQKIKKLKSDSKYAQQILKLTNPT